MTPRILGIVTDMQGSFICRRCFAEVVMVAVIDARSVKSRVWRETSTHKCSDAARLERLQQLTQEILRGTPNEAN